MKRIKHPIILVISLDLLLILLFLWMNYKYPNSIHSGIVVSKSHKSGLYNNTLQEYISAKEYYSVKVYTKGKHIWVLIDAIDFNNIEIGDTITY